MLGGGMQPRALPASCSRRRACSTRCPAGGRLGRGDAFSAGEPRSQLRLDHCITPLRSDQLRYQPTRARY
eukprot:575839-Rhodomonas_salina.1